MDRNNTSLFSRCRRMLSKREGSRRASETQRTSSWPRPMVSEEDTDVISDDDCAPLLDASFEKAHITSRSRSSSRSSTVSRARDQILTIPPWCRLSPTRFITVTYMMFIILLIVSSASAAPLQHQHIHQLTKRQAIPDRFGNTGNDPAPVASQPPPRPLATSEAPSAAASEAATSIISIQPSTPAPTSSSPIISSRPQPLPSSQQAIASASPPASQPAPPLPPASQPTTSTPTLSPNGRPEEQLQRTSPGSPFTPGLIAGIAGGSAIVLGLLIGIGFFLYCRRRAATDIQEIPIRRSKLGSRLGFRMFGPSSRRPSRSPSAASKYTVRSDSSQRGLAEKKELDVSTGSGNRSTFGSVSGWLDKTTISRPKPAYVDTSSQFLELPKPLFAEREAPRDDAPWKPRRPDADAAPLGRLSGMGFGLGMGRASGMR